MTVSQEIETHWEKAFILMENKKSWGKVQTHIHQMFGNPSRVPPLLDGATYSESFIMRIHPIMHNQVLVLQSLILNSHIQGHISHDCTNYIKAHLQMKNVASKVSVARDAVLQEIDKVVGMLPY